jgi:hypothetical protein
VKAFPRPVLAAALAAGALARVAVAFLRPLWADEIFTLALARRSVPEILAALRVDSGPPLHYLAAHVLLLPFPAPGAGDVVVRLFSLVCSLLHLPLLLRVGRRLGRPGAGALAAALYAVFPLAVLYGVEGRGYALASLLVLLAFERALALRERPRIGTGAALALAAAGAALTHYLAVFPAAALALLALSARPASRRVLLLALGAAAVLAGAWAPVALRQPPAAMAWARDPAFAGALRDFPANLAFGIEPPPGSLALPLAALGGALVAALLLRERRGVLSPAAGVLSGSLLLLALAQIATGALVLPGRTAVVFLPFVALLLASAPPAVPLAAGTLALAFLARALPSVPGPSPGETLARLLEAPARAGKTIAAAGYWGPELDYRLARAGSPGRVVLFPSSVAAHPGWYREEDAGDETLAREAGALLARPSPPTVFVLPRGSRASAALASRLGPARRLVASPLVDVVETRPASPRALPNGGRAFDGSGPP